MRVKEKNMNKSNMLKLERAFQYLKMNFGTLMSKITPTWKMRKLYLWWCHSVHGNAFRRIIKINEELFELNSTTYTCNVCGGVVFKGDTNNGIVLNCPKCGAIFSVSKDFPRKFRRSQYIQSASSNTDCIDKNSKYISI